jgi:hypothetical protein
LIQANDKSLGNDFPMGMPGPSDLDGGYPLGDKQESPYRLKPKRKGVHSGDSDDFSSRKEDHNSGKNLQRAE